MKNKQLNIRLFSILIILRISSSIKTSKYNMLHETYEAKSKLQNSDITKQNEINAKNIENASSVFKNNLFSNFHNYDEYINSIFSLKDSKNSDDDKQQSLYSFDLDSLKRNSIDLPILNDHLSIDFNSNSLSSNVAVISNLKNVRLSEIKLDNETINKAMHKHINKNSIKQLIHDERNKNRTLNYDFNSDDMLIEKELKPIIVPILKIENNK